ncbi:MAG: hypothetical protein F6K31_07410 [Symploca sp. SIO2G7]|nr:hypothetical protein [Symploca sp. SIO2G7]
MRTAKPLLHYLDGGVPRQLAAHFGDYLEGLPKYQKFDIIRLVADVGSNDTDPFYDHFEGNYDLIASSENQGIILKEEEYGIPLLSMLNSLGEDELLALCAFLVDDLRHSQGGQS